MHYGTNRSVLDPPAQSNRPERRVAKVDSHAKIKFQPGFTPDLQQLRHPLPERNRRPHGLAGRIIGRQRVVEQHRHTIFDEGANGSLESEDHLSQRLVIGAQHRDGFLWCVGFRQRIEAG